MLRDAAHALVTPPDQLQMLRAYTRIDRGDELEQIADRIGATVWNRPPR